jgi:WD40 repeat protein
VLLSTITAFLPKTHIRWKLKILDQGSRILLYYVRIRVILMNAHLNHEQKFHAKSGNRGKRITRTLARRFSTPAVGFLFITIILSASVFIFSMKSGVPKFSLPTLVELTSSNVASIAKIYQIENGVEITSLLFSPDGLYLAVARLDNILHIWSTKDYHLIYSFTTESLCGDCIAFSPDSRFIAAVRAGRPYDVIVWDLETGKSPWESMGTLVKPDESISGVAFSPDGRLLAEAIENRVLFWEVDEAGYVLAREIVGHSAPVKSLAFSPDGRRLLTTSADMTAKVWDVNTGDWLITLSGHTGIVAKGIYSPDGIWLVTAGYDRTIRFWDSQTGALMKVILEYTTPVSKLAYSPNGQILASSGVRERIILWDGLTWVPLLIMKEPGKDDSPLAFSPDNKIFASTSSTNTLWVWGVKK